MWHEAWVSEMTNNVTIIKTGNQFALQNMIYKLWKLLKIFKQYDSQCFKILECKNI